MPKIYFFNQMAGRLFREMAQEMAKVWSPSILFTGHPDTLRIGSTEHLVVKPGPVYDKRSLVKRILSWIKYFLFSLYQSLIAPRESLLFFSTNPPFLGIIGYINKKLFGKRYVVLVYDIYPEIPIALGWLKKNGITAKIWLWINKLSYENAEAVFTIGEYMAKNLERQFDPAKTTLDKIFVVPPWVDTDFIKPIDKSKNWFAQKHGQVDKFTILYSGNLGATYGIECIIDLAIILEKEKDIHFLVIGDGFKRKWLEEVVAKEAFRNITLLPPQPEGTLPYSLSTGDLAIIALSIGSEEYMVPSSMPYYLAAGCHFLYMGHPESEIGAFCLNEKSGCAHHCNTIHDAATLIKMLSLAKENRTIASNLFYLCAEKQYSKATNAAKFISSMQQIIGQVR